MSYYRKSHPPVYYHIRSLVRGVFWTGVFAGAVFGISAVVNNDKPECPVTLNFDFTYTVDEPYDPASCREPINVILKDDGRWEWAN